MHICILGDSHVPALKQGLTQIAHEMPELQITYFAGPRPEYEHVSASDGSLVTASDILRYYWTRSSRGLDRVGDGYDVYVVYALGFAANTSLRDKISLPQIAYSSDAMTQMIYSNLRGSPGFHTASELRKITSKRILIVQAPHQPQASSEPLHILTGEALRSVVDQVDAAGAALAKTIGAAFVRQAKRTIADDGATTRTKFAADGPPGRWHVNRDYGAILARQLLRRLNRRSL